MYSTMEYYEDIFPVIYINMIKVGAFFNNRKLCVNTITSLFVIFWGPSKDVFITWSLDSPSEIVEFFTLSKRVKKIVIPNLLQFFGMLFLLVAGTMYAIPSIQDVFKNSRKI
mgnify:CR=1 FL=1